MQDAIEAEVERRVAREPVAVAPFSSFAPVAPEPVIEPVYGPRQFAAQLMALRGGI